METTMLEWRMVIFPISALLYYFLMFHLDKKHVRQRPLSDEEFMAFMARRQGCSEYDIFLYSAEEWRVPRTAIDGDFKTYLLTQQMPYYVKDFVRKGRQMAG